MIIHFNDTANRTLEIAVNDNSYRYRAIRGDHNLTLCFSLAEHVEIPVGAYCVFENETYTLEKPESLKMQHSRNFEYTVVFESSQAKAGKWKFRNPVDRRLKFSLTATPREHLQVLVDNMNQRDEGWTIGRCIDAPEKTISYNHAFCIGALTQMADEFETEYEFIGKQVSLWKVEYDRDNPLPLAYGKGNGFKPGIGRSNYEDATPVEILYVQGGAQNLDTSRYGSPELLLPKKQTIRFDGLHFEDEEGFDASKARVYATDADGFSIQRADKPLSSRAEESLDCSEIYPKRVGTVSSVEAVDAAKNFYDFVDEEIPAALNFGEYLIGGETMSVVFQSGMLAGREFEVKYYHDPKGGKAGRRFELVPQEIDGMTMPGGNFVPKAGDSYAVFHCMLPAAYICDDAAKSGASWELFREGVKFLYDNEQLKFSFTGELDGVWAKRDWNNIGGRIRLGGFVHFTDVRLLPEGVLVRIIGIKDYVNDPHCPEIELSNSTVGRTVSSELRKIASNEVVMDDLHREALRFTKRRFRDSRETLEMLKDAMLENFTQSVSPLSVQAMMMLVGDESLQFRFVKSMADPRVVAHDVRYDATAKVLSAPAGVIQHMTLGIGTISAAHATGEYKFWELPAFRTPALADPAKRYYLYAKVSAADPTGVFYISDRAVGMDSVEGCYHLLLGLLNSEYDGDRSYVSLYGFTEILPGRMTTDKIVSSDGKTYFDLSRGEIGGNISLAASEDYKEVQTGLKDLQTDLDTIKSQTDKEYTIWFYDHKPALDNLPASQWATDELKSLHDQDMFYNAETGLAYRFEQAEEGAFVWSDITDHQTVKALETAAKAQDTADGKRRVFVSQPTPPYDAGDLWLTGGSADGELKKCITARATGAYNAADWVVGVSYDNTKTVINGGLITSGTVQLASDDTRIKAGITGAGAADSSVRIWAGESFANRVKAPFRVMQDGSVVMSKATVEGDVKAISGSIGGFEIGQGRIGATASENGGSGGLAIYNHFFRIGGKTGYAMLGNDVIPASTGGAFSAVGRIVNSKPNTGAQWGFDTANYGLFMDVSGGTKNYGISSNAALIAPSFVGTRAGILTFGSDSYKVDFSQHNIILMSFRDPNHGSVAVDLPSESSVAEQFGLVSLPADFATTVTFRVRPGSNKIILKGIYNHNEKLQDYPMLEGDSVTVLITKIDGFRYQILNHFD